jgi:hypothetical protein
VAKQKTDVGVFDLRVVFGYVRAGKTGRGGTESFVVNPNLDPGWALLTGVPPAYQELLAVGVETAFTDSESILFRHDRSEPEW